MAQDDTTGETAQTGHRYARIAFTDAVHAVQEVQGSRESYRRHEEGPAHHHRLGAAEAAFIAARDSFFMASVSATGWPYVQHRGGPPGFLRVLDERTLGFADFRGNRQYVSVGNIAGDGRVSLILLDHAARRRLKIFGRARLLDPTQESETMARLELPDYRARVERGLLIDVAAFDWNCPQHITPRFTAAELADALAPFKARIPELESALTPLSGRTTRDAP